MNDKICVICEIFISAERLANQPRAVTCSGPCSALHHYNQVKAQGVARRERLRKDRQAATA